MGRQLGVWHYGSPESARALKKRETGFRWWRACVGSSECARLQHGGTACGSGTVLPRALSCSHSLARAHRSQVQPGPGLHACAVLSSHRPRAARGPAGLRARE